MLKPGLYLTHTRLKAHLRFPAHLTLGARRVEALVTAEQVYDKTAERGLRFTEEMPGGFQSGSQGKRRAKRHTPAGPWRSNQVGDRVLELPRLGG